MMLKSEKPLKISIDSSPKLNIRINNPFSVKQLFNNMSTDLTLVISYIDLAINECAEKNLYLVSQKEKITNLTNLAKKYNIESINLDSRLREYHNTISILEHDVLKFKNSLDGVMAITSDLPISDTDKIKNILEDSFMKKSQELEITIEELKLFKKNMNVKNDKTIRLQHSLSKMEVDFVEQTSITNSFCSNVEENVLHIAKTYFDVMSKANDILQITIDVKQNNNHDINKIPNLIHYKQNDILKNDVLPKQMELS